MSKKFYTLLACGTFGLGAACGGGTPPPKEPEGIPLSDSTATASKPTPPAETAAPSATAAASASAAPEKKPKPQPGGAPMAVSEDASEVTTTYGARGGKIRIGGTAELTVPADAVETGTNFTLGLNTGKDQLKITPYKGQVGDLYRIGVKRPDGPVGQVASAGSPFLLKLPLPKGTKTANLVIAVATGGKTGKYGVFPPKSIEEGDTSYAVFELPNIVPEAMIHLTSAAPSP